jgi:hypothetical protein
VIEELIIAGFATVHESNLTIHIRWPITASFDDVVHKKIHSFMLDFFSEGANCVGTRNDTLSWS